MTEMNNTRELAANIIDIFEDFLASIGKVIPCSDPRYRRRTCRKR